MRSRDRLQAAAICVAGLMLVPAGAANAQESGTAGKFQRYGGYSDRFFIQVGSYFPGHETIVRLDTETVGGSTIRLEDDLGLPNNTADFRVEGYVRFGRRHRLRLGWVSMKRDVTHRLTGEIVWGGRVFPVDSEVTGTWNSDVVKAEYRFSAISTERVDLGVSLGVFALSVTSGIGAPGSNIDSVRTSRDAPLPMAGLDLEYFPVERLLLRAGGQVLGIKIGGVEGQWYDARLSAEYYPWSHFGLGFGYNFSRVDIDAEITDGRLSHFAYDYKFNGPQVFLIGVF